jgi:alanyl-tRNA synthetase
VDSDWLRFDFSHQDSLSDDDLKQIEGLSNEKISQGASIRWDTVALAQARELGAMMLFGEKYPDPVRMVSMGDFSRELCGGTHASNTAEIGTLEILTDESVSAGVRRITALTGPRALEYRAKIEAQAALVAQKLGCSIDQLAPRTLELVSAIRKLKKIATSAGGNEAPPVKVGGQKSSAGSKPAYADIRSALKQAARAMNVSLDEVGGRMDALLAEENQLHEQLAQLSSASNLDVDQLIASAQAVGPTLVIVARVPNANTAMMRQWIDQIRKKSAKPVAVLFATHEQDKVTLLAGLSQSLVDQGYSAGKWIAPVAEVVGGSGGGRPDFAQAGGKLPGNIDQALAIAKSTWQSIAGS